MNTAFRTREMDHFFMIMAGLAKANATKDCVAVREWVDELDMIIMHGSQAIMHRSAAEAYRARSWLKAQGPMQATFKIIDTASLGAAANEN